MSFPRIDDDMRKCLVLSADRPSIANLLLAQRMQDPAEMAKAIGQVPPDGENQEGC